MHQTGRNSGVIHSGLYHKPGSQKAELCARGRAALYEFCRTYEIPHERCGKVVVATTEDELGRLDELQRRGAANGLDDLQRLGPKELEQHEPYVRGLAGLLVPQTGIVNYRQVAEKMAVLVRDEGHNVCTESRVLRVYTDTGRLRVSTTRDEHDCDLLINCAGLHSDRVAAMCGVRSGVRIVPFRGEYYQLAAGRHDLVRNLIYPVPDPRFPFLGVHFTRMIASHAGAVGGVEAGPNAVLAFRREGYRRLDFSLIDLYDLAAHRGFWKMARTHWRTGLMEMHRSWSKRAFLHALQRLIPNIGMEDLVPGGAGVRAQAVDENGRLLDDFHILDSPCMIHVLNAPSPAATASLAIGQVIADRALKRLGTALHDDQCCV